MTSLTRNQDMTKGTLINFAKKMKNLESGLEQVTSQTQGNTNDITNVATALVNIHVEVVAHGEAMTELQAVMIPPPSTDLMGGSDVHHEQ